MIKIGLGLSLTALRGGGGGGLATFTNATESDTLFAAFTASGQSASTRRQYMIDRWIKKLKAGGVWPALRGLWIIGDTEGQTAINWKTPGTNNLTKNGAPTWTIPEVAKAGAPSTSTGYTVFSTTAFLDTGFALSTVNQNSFAWGDFHRSTSTNSGRNNGALDGSNGISTILYTTGPMANIRAMGAEVTTIGVNADHDGFGLHSINRISSSEFEYWHNSLKVATVANTAVSSAASTTLTFGKCNGSGSGGTGAFMGGYLASRALTDDEMDLLYRGIRSIIQSVQWGDVLINEAGYLPATVNAEVIVYGWTWQGVVAAYTAKREGKTVALVGGWDDHTPTAIGGVSANGLGLNDIDNTTALSAIPKDIIDRIVASGEGTGTRFTPNGMNWILRQMLDPSRTDGQDIELYESNGVLSATKPTDRITSMTCADGRTYSGIEFLDCTYEIDLAAVAAISFVTGIEAAGTGADAANGYRGGRGNVAYGSNTVHQSYRGGTAGTYVRVDPWNTPGDTGSGLIAAVTAAPGLSVGAADTTTQAYSFRQTWTNQVSKRKAFRSTPRSGYDSTYFEVLKRYYAAATALTLTVTSGDILKISSLGVRNIYDINSAGIMSNDWVGSGTAYAALTTYDQRRSFKQSLHDYTEDLIYFHMYDSDPRIQTGPRTTLAGYGYSVDHYLDPAPGRLPYRSDTIYVREFRRMVGEMVWTATDLAQTDGGTPRSIKTIAVASYAVDSHAHRRVADNSAGTWTVWGDNEIFVAAANGANSMAPTPREIYIPQRAECVNLGVVFGCSCNHPAMGSIRMEDTSTMAAQSLAMLCAIAIENGNQALHDVSDATFRTRMAALPEATPAYLPQVA